MMNHQLLAVCKWSFSIFTVTNLISWLSPLSTVWGCSISWWQCTLPSWMRCRTRNNILMTLNATSFDYLLLTITKTALRIAEDTLFLPHCFSFFMVPPENEHSFCWSPIQKSSTCEPPQLAITFKVRIFTTKKFIYSYLISLGRC
jgi:hypothetical protein